MRTCDSSELAAHLGCQHQGASLSVATPASPEKASKQGTLTYIGSEKYLKRFNPAEVCVVIAPAALAKGLKDHALMLSEAPRRHFAQALAYLFPESMRPQPKPDIHPTAVIDETATVAEDVYIGAHCVVESGVRIESGVYLQANITIGQNTCIGKDSALYAGVVIYQGSVIGEACVIHSGAIIGSDGFGNEPTNEGWVKVPQIGNVIIGNRVEIGANTTIDCGAIEDTVIHDGVKLDNLIQVGHNCTIGENTAIAASTAIAGSSIIGKNCTIAGQVGIAGHLKICDNTHITGKTLVSKSITQAGSYSSSTPMDTTDSWRKNTVRFRQLDTLAKQLKTIEKELKQFKESS